MSSHTSDRGSSAGEQTNKQIIITQAVNHWEFKVIEEGHLVMLSEKGQGPKILLGFNSPHNHFDSIMSTQPDNIRHYQANINCDLKCT